MYRPHIDGSWPGSGLDSSGRCAQDAWAWIPGGPYRDLKLPLGSGAAAGIWGGRWDLGRQTSLRAQTAHATGEADALWRAATGINTTRMATAAHD